MTSLATEPVVGWRLWHVKRDPAGEPELRSWARDGVWPARRRMEAGCGRLLRRGCERAPGRNHVCGIYAARAREGAEALLHALPPLVAPIAIGRVSLWGRVIENVGGWRAEYAYPYDVEVLGGDERLVRSLRARYLIDVSSPA